MLICTTDHLMLYYIRLFDVASGYESDIPDMLRRCSLYDGGMQTDATGYTKALCYVAIRSRPVSLQRFFVTGYTYRQYPAKGFSNRL